MALGLFGIGKNKSSGRAAFTGFHQVRPVLSPNGTEKFGLIELATDYAGEVFAPCSHTRRRGEAAEPVYTGVVRLSGPGLNRWLADPKEDRDFFSSLCLALPTDSPSQFLLQRRSGQLSEHYASLQAAALTRMGDEEVAHFFLQDYLDSLVYPVEDSGLARWWCGLLVSGRSEEDLTNRLARLVASLPCEATPCMAAELSRMLLDYFAPGHLAAEQTEDPADIADTLYSNWLSETPLEVFADGFSNGQLNAFWTLSAPPLREEGGWTRGLLENELLANTEFDIALHLAPAIQGKAMGEVLQRRLEVLNQRLTQAQAEGRREEAIELAEQHFETRRRLDGLQNPDHRYFEAGLSITLHSPPETFEENCELFEQELRNCGLAAHRTTTVAQSETAMRDCAPLNLSLFDRPFVLPAHEAGRLAHLLTISPPAPAPALPLAGLNQANEPVYLNPAAQPGQSAFFLLGEVGKASTVPARNLVRYLAATRWLKGGVVWGLDRKGDWLRLVNQLGGRYIGFGPHETEYSFNPLEVTVDTLNQVDTLQNWINDMTGFLGAILALDEDLQEDLKAVLVEAAFNRVSRAEELNAASLWIRAETSGYTRLAEQLRQLTRNGRYGWLCGRPTRLPVAGNTGSDFVFLGLAGSVRAAWDETTQRYFTARLFARLAAQIGNRPAPAERPALLVLDEAHQLLTDPAGARALGWLEQQSRRCKTSLWLVSPRTDEWLNSYTGRNLLEKSQTHLFFNQNGAGLSGTARRMNLSQRFLKAVREAVPGAAVVREVDEDGQPVLYALDPLPGDYMARLACPPAQFNPPVTLNEAARPAPIEVPLFATEEIWVEQDLDLEQAAAPVEVVAEAAVELAAEESQALALVAYA